MLLVYPAAGSNMSDTRRRKKAGGLFIGKYHINRAFCNSDSFNRSKSLSCPETEEDDEEFVFVAGFFV